LSGAFALRQIWIALLEQAQASGLLAPPAIMTRLAAKTEWVCRSKPAKDVLPYSQE